MIVNWNWFAKKYWKKILILIFLATISTASFLLLARNGAEKIYSLLRQGSEKTNPKYIFYSFGGKSLLDFGKSWKNYLLFVITLAVISCFLTAFSYYYRNHLVSLVSNDLKQKSLSKLYKLKEKATKGQEKRMFGVVYHQSKELGNYFVLLPDNLYIFSLTTILVFYELKSASGASIWAGLIYFILASLLSFVFNRLISQRRTELEKATEKQTEVENNLINNRKLIIKKGLTNNFFRNYQKVSQTVKQKADKETFFSSLYKSTFSYLIRFGKFFLLLILLIFVPNANDFIIFTMFTKLTTSFNYLIKGIRKYPQYSSSQKRFNYFLNLPERNDIQKNIFIYEPITNVALQKVSFSYEKDKPVLKEINLVFEKGRVNHFQASNGFGKTTIIDLIFGLYQPNEGEILINNKCKLNELNLAKWREKIAYAESANLVKSNLSLGQKQLTDLQNTIEKDKEIYIFDEAENNLDENNKNTIEKKLETLSRKKIVIVMSTKKQ